MTFSFDTSRHPDFVTLLAKIDFVPAYLELCTKYSTWVGIDGPHIDMAGLLAIFRNLGVKTTLHKRFKTFEFDDETITGWEWKGSLVIKRYDMLEPMMEGQKGKYGVGSTFLSLAINAGALRDPPVRIDPPYPRPCFDGDMRTMERMVPDLVALFRSVKDAIRGNW
jgi:hypothetical protein